MLKVAEYKTFNGKSQIPHLLSSLFLQQKKIKKKINKYIYIYIYLFIKA